MKAKKLTKEQDLMANFGLSLIRYGYNQGVKMKTAKDIAQKFNNKTVNNYVFKVALESEIIEYAKLKVNEQRKIIANCSVKDINFDSEEMRIETHKKKSFFKNAEKKAKIKYKRTLS